jgi:hypothetical protein
VENLFEDIKDGVYLLSLLEVLSGEKLVSWLNVELKFVLRVTVISTYWQNVIITTGFDLNVDWIIVNIEINASDRGFAFRKWRCI